MSREFDFTVLKENEQLDIKKMEENLSKLCCLSKDDKTEAAMLRSRIDEQSRLIMALKQRADVEINRVLALDRANKELLESRDEFSERWRQESLTSHMLEKRFNELASNHEEMILFKDDYKRCNVKLREENAKLKEENGRQFNASIQEKAMQLENVTRKMRKLNEDHIALDTRFRDIWTKFKEKEIEHQSTVEELNTTHSAKVKSLIDSVNDLQQRLKGATDEVSLMRGKLDKLTEVEEQNVKQLTKEKNEMLELAMQRGKLVHKEQDTNKHLLTQITDMERKVKNMQDKFMRESSAVNVNLRVRDLQECLDEKSNELTQLETKFEAYKKHTNSLLQKERELNEKLRHLTA